MKAPILCLGWICAAAAFAAESDGPKPISEAERAAVSFAADYLAMGSGSWWPVLSEDAPLKALGKEAALEEIAVRCGPPEDAIWRLQTAAPGWEKVVVFTIEYPSGLDEVLSLELVQEGAWRIAHVRIFSEPAPHRTGIEDVLDIPEQAVGVGTLPPIAPWTLLLVVLLAVAAYPKLGRTAPRAVSLGLIFCSLGLLVWSCSQQEEEKSVEESFPRLASLLTLRESLATGGVDPEPLFAELRAEVVEGEVGRVWEAAYRILRFELDEARAILDTYPSPASIAAVEALRARLGFLQSNEVETLLGYEQVREVGPDHDGIRLEMALRYAQLGYADKSEIEFVLLGDMGSREADAYYALAQFAALDRREEEGIEHFKMAWNLQPAEREAIFSDLLMAYLSTRPEVFPMLELSNVEEPVVGLAPADRQPLGFPEGAELRLSGELLEVILGDSTLMLPGGGVMADVETPIEDAGARIRREEEAALARLDTLIESSGTPGALAQPLLRRQTQAAALALFRSHEWEQLIELTDGLIHSVGHAPPILAKLRARALSETGRGDDATDLLLALAKIDLDRGRQDPATLYQLAEVFASAENYDLAVRLLRKAESFSPFEPDYTRLRRLHMQQKLAENHQAYESKHFNIRYPKITGEKYARQVSIVLEEEWNRLQKWIPLQSTRLLDVDLFPIIEFLESYSENVVGIYDGRIRVPLADLRSLHPQLVALLSHELAHAMIAERTQDAAPKWFHEGLAQHVEMVHNTANPVRDLVPADRMLSLSVVEDVLNGFVEPQFVEISYSLSAWALHFIEREFGRGSISSLMKAFAVGQDTEEALVSVLGVSPADFDRRFRDWALNKAPAVWPTDLRRYDTEAAVAELLGGGRKQSTSRTTAASPMRRPTKAIMSQWYRQYTSRFGVVKSALVQAVAVLDGRDRSVSLDFACGQLQRELRRARSDNRLLNSPDPEVSGKLRTSLRDLSSFADTCVKNEGGEETHSRLQAAEKSLIDLITALQGWGL